MITAISSIHLAYSFLLPLHRTLHPNQNRVARTETIAFAAEIESTEPSRAGNLLSPKPKKKKKKKFAINPNVETEAIAFSEGILTPKKREPTQPSKLGVPSKRKPIAKTKKKLDTKSEKIRRQRTANDTVDSRFQSMISDPIDQNVQIQVAKRGNKEVTIIRGLTSTMDERKALLKDFKQKLGVGGTLAEGVLEVQGAHAETILDALKAKGYNRAKKVGK